MEWWAHVTGLVAARHGANAARAHKDRVFARSVWSQFQERFFVPLGLALLTVGGSHAQKPASDTSGPPVTASSSPSSFQGASFESSPPFGHELTFGDRTHIYFKSLIEPEAIARPLLGAAVDQGIDTPPQWGQGAAGFDRRAASGFAQEFAAKTIQFGVAAVDHEDPRIYASGLHGFAPRLRFAVVHTFISRTDGGGQSFAVSRMAGIYGGAFIANTWFPAGYNNFSHGFSRGSVDLGVDVGFHVLREFLPDIKNGLVFSLK